MRMKIYYYKDSGVSLLLHLYGIAINWASFELCTGAYVKDTKLYFQFTKEEFCLWILLYKDE
jgi:hypothetical protein